MNESTEENYLRTQTNQTIRTDVGGYINDMPDTHSVLEMKVAGALHNKENWVETDPETMTAVLRNDSWRAVGSFFYKGVEVFAKGTHTKLVKEREKSSEEFMHGQISHTPKEK